MPIHWDDDPDRAPVNAGALSYKDGTAPAAHAVLCPNRSLPPEGFAWVISIAFALILIPAIPFLGTRVLWALLPFLLGAVWLLWIFLRRNYRDGQLTEELFLWSDRIEVRRTDPRGAVRQWCADPYWVRVRLHEHGGPVSDYVTLSGAGREIELGTFLSPDERKSLYTTLSALLSRLR